jgi:hypothetical protein
MTTLQTRLRQRAKPIRERLSAPTATDLREPYDSMLTEAADLLDAKDAEIAKLRSLLAAPSEPVAWMSPEILDAIKTHPYGNTVLCGRKTEQRTVALYLSAPQSAVPLPFTNAQLRRLWNNSPQIAPDVKSCEAFKRVVRLAEAAHGITQPPKGE